MSTKKGSTIRSLTIKAQVDAYLARLFNSVRLEAGRVAIALGFGGERNPARAVNRELSGRKSSTRNRRRATLTMALPRSPDSTGCAACGRSKLPWT
jgi:hypothetical protein